MKRISIASVIIGLMLASFMPSASASDLEYSAGYSISKSVENCVVVARVLAEYAHRVFVLWLPKYCPQLSLIERFWEHMKQVVFDNYYFGDESNLEEAVHLFFKEHNTQPPSDLTIDFRLSKNLSED